MQANIAVTIVMSNYGLHKFLREKWVSTGPFRMVPAEAGTIVENTKNA